MEKVSDKINKNSQKQNNKKQDKKIQDKRIKKLIKINELKKEILEVQITKLGEITSDNLKTLNYENEVLLQDLLIEEQQKKNNDDYINNYNTKYKELEEQYNTKKILNKMKIDYNNKVKIKKDSYNTRYNKLQKTLRELEYSRNSAMNLNNSYKIDIDIKNDDIYKKKQYILLLQLEIRNLKVILDNLNKECNDKLKSINNKYNTRFNSLECKEIINEEITSESMMGGTSKSKLLSWCSNKKHIVPNKLFLDKYIIYLTEFLELCNYYNTIGNIPNRCIMFTDEQVSDKINELKRINENFSEDNYIIDEEAIKNNHNNTINTKKEYYKNKIIKLNNKHNLFINNLNNLIKHYNSLKKLNTGEENMKLLDDLDKNIFDLNEQIIKLEEEYLKLNRDIKSHKKDCLKKTNNLTSAKILLIEECLSNKSENDNI